MKALKKLCRRPKVQKVVTDFEKAIWGGVRAVFPDVKLSGCSFHWSQAVMRKVQEFGFQTLYMQKGAVHRFIRHLLALPFLPAEHITTSFNQLNQRNPACLQLLMDYVLRTWICRLWSPADWSVYGCATWTNNDVEGWHNRLNKQAVRGQLHLYRLLQILHAEGSLIALQMQLVSENKLKRFQRKQTREAQGQYFSLWRKYGDNQISTAQLLRSCSRI